MSVRGRKRNGGDRGNRLWTNGPLDQIPLSARHLPREALRSDPARRATCEVDPMTQVDAAGARNQEELRVVRTATVVVGAAVAFGVLPRLAAMMMRDDGARVVARSPSGPDRARDVLDVLGRQAA